MVGVPAEFIERHLHDRQHGFCLPRCLHVRLQPTRSFDLDRLLHYTQFTSHGLTIHDRGIEALIRFMATRAELFRTIYFHRTVRAIDLTLGRPVRGQSRLFAAGLAAGPSGGVPGLTEFSLLVDVTRWADADDAPRRSLGQRWQALIAASDPVGHGLSAELGVSRRGCRAGKYLQSSRSWSSKAWRENWVRSCRIYRCESTLPDTFIGRTRRVRRSIRIFFTTRRRIASVRSADHQLFRHLPISHRICRVYTSSRRIRPANRPRARRAVGHAGPG